MSERIEGSPSVYHTVELQESCRIIEEAAVKRQSGFFGLTLTQEQCSHLGFAVLEQIESLEESYESDEPEVKDALRCLLEVAPGLCGRGERRGALPGPRQHGGAGHW